MSENQFTFNGAFNSTNTTFTGGEITFKKNPDIIFYNDKSEEIGRLYHEDGNLHFKGDVDASAQVFFDKLLKINNK